MRGTKAERVLLQAYEAYADAIFRYCLFRIRDKTRAEDLVQEVYIRVWNYLVKGKKVDSMKAFLYRVAQNLIIDLSRKKQKKYSLEEKYEQGIEPIGQDAKDILASIDCRDLLEHLDRISKDDRDLIWLRFVEGYKPKEIAKMYNEKTNVISVRIHRAKKNLQTLWNVI